MVDPSPNEKVKERAWSSVLGGVITTAIILLGTLVWLFWPYPSVTTEGTATLINLDERGYYQTGDIIKWTTPQVCQPSGRTDVVIQAVLDFSGPNGAEATSDTVMVSRSFDVKGFPECTTNNPTTAYVDGNLPTGTYRLLVEACVQNPTPRPKCDTFAGPTGVKIVRIAGNEKTAP